MSGVIATLDFETDPFEYGKVPMPFCVDFFDGEKHVLYWGDDCAARVIAYIKALPERHIIYAHNGGKFDFFYFIEHFESDMKIINGRIVKANIGKHEFRDSFAALPVGLKQYKKDDIDYNKLHRNCREKHRYEIIEYLKSDCVYLRELVTSFQTEFGDILTIASAAMKELKKFHKYKCGNKTYDEKFRKFYFGGRNQCFKAGVIKQRCRIYDVNSMYPFAMKGFLHPVGTLSEISKRIQPNTCFVVCEGENKGAFPLRSETGGLDFTGRTGTYHITIHEFEASQQTGTFKCNRILKTYGFDERITFEEFVDHFFDARKLAKKDGDKIHDLFYKLVLNSAYGKFAQNPEHYFDWCITPLDKEALGKYLASDSAWKPAFIHYGKYIVWKKPLDQHSFYNVATAASITGAARALLLRGIAAATKPLYCDTDSIICDSLNARLDDSELGAWKLEGEGDTAAIAGKKLYAIYKDGLCIKKAHKGSRLTGDEILRVAQGETVTYVNPVPAFNISGKHFTAPEKVFIKRRIKNTATNLCVV
jgi:hypothetical protein